MKKTSDKRGFSELQEIEASSDTSQNPDRSVPSCHSADQVTNAMENQQTFFLENTCFLITLRIARPRNALQRAILRRAILSRSFIRIARPIYFGFFVLKCPSNSPMCCLEQLVLYLRKTLTKIDSIPKVININFEKILKTEGPFLLPVPYKS